MKQLCCYVSALSVMLQMKSLLSKTLLSSLLKVVVEALKEPSLKKSEKALIQKAIIDKLLLAVVSNTNASECHNPSDSNSNVAQNVVENRAESAPVETQRDHLSGRCFVSCMHGQCSVVFNETIHTYIHVYVDVVRSKHRTKCPCKCSVTICMKQFEKGFL